MIDATYLFFLTGTTMLILKTITLDRMLCMKNMSFMTIIYIMKTWLAMPKLVWQSFQLKVLRRLSMNFMSIKLMFGVMLLLLRLCYRILLFILRMRLSTHLSKNTRKTCSKYHHQIIPQLNLKSHGWEIILFSLLSWVSYYFVASVFLLIASALGKRLNQWILWMEDYTMIFMLHIIWV